MNTSTSTDAHSQTPPPTEERLAQLTGFAHSPTQPAHLNPSSPTQSSLLSDEDLEEQITRHSFASSPLSKLVFVAGAVFIVVFIASLFLSQFQSPGESVSAKKTTDIKPDQQSSLLSTENKDPEKEELLSELALREQQEGLKNLESQKAKKNRLVTDKVSAKPVVTTATVRPTPVRQVIRPTPPIPRPLPVRYSQPIRPLTVVHPKQIKPLQAAPSNPSQLWTQLAQVGSFGGGVVSTSPSNNSKRLMPQYQPKTASNNVIAHNNQQMETSVPPISPINSSPANVYQAIPFGQSVSAVLENAIAWEGSRGNRTTQPSDDRYIVTLTEPLKNKFGNLKIPSGSQLVIRLEKGNNALVTLTAESLIVNGTETPLPQGALKIRGADNQPLVAEMTTLGGDDHPDNTQALADVLSIAGDFADIPGSRSLSTLYQSLTGGNTRRSGSGITTTVFFLRKGTPLEVFVNQTFSLDAPESPLELNLNTLEFSHSPIALELTNSIEEDGK